MTINEYQKQILAIW